jgi:hypothetical protein
LKGDGKIKKSEKRRENNFTTFLAAVVNKMMKMITVREEH